jgi:PAS domain-containing protein
MEIELILMRQLAAHLAMPVFIVGKDGALLFYNEAAHEFLGRSYEENGDMVLEEWAASFRPRRENGEPVPTEELPIVIALRERRATHVSPLIVTGKNEVPHRIAVTAFPLVGQQDRELGAVAIFWEV